MTSRGFGVLIGVLVAGPISGAHLNPAVRSLVTCHPQYHHQGHDRPYHPHHPHNHHYPLIPLHHSWLSDPIQHCSCCRGQIWLEEGANKYFYLSGQIVYLSGQIVNFSGQIFLFEWTNSLFQWTNILFQWTNSLFQWTNIFIWVDK